MTGRKKKKMAPSLYFSQYKFNRSVGETATIYCQVVETKQHYEVIITLGSDKTPQAKVLEIPGSPLKKYVKTL